MNTISPLPDRTPGNQAYAAPGAVLIVCPGGLENGGGIGRQMGYFVQARGSHRPGVEYSVVDSRGPWFLGASRRHVVLAILYLAASCVKLIQARVSPVRTVAHINITGRGSTIRKAVLVAVAQAIGLRYLLHVHDYDYAAEYNRHGWLLKAVIRRIFRKARKVLVLGARDRQSLSHLLNLAPDQISVLHNAVPDPQPRLPRHSQGEPCQFLFLGHLSARKGVPELLHALASPLLAAARWRATLAGGGPIDEFQHLAADLGISERVTFPGWLDQAAVKAACDDADVLVLPSHAEGLAMAILEGLSHGLAVIATPVGAHTEVIEPDVSGILVPPGDVDALAASLLKINENEELRSRLQTGARRRFTEKFDIRVYAMKLSSLHAALLADEK
jgi:glycosyltransferase involved in cell wall biosynthesis